MEVADDFHKNVTALFEKTGEPCGPENYRGKVFPTSDAYVLLHEEEQHLADNLAFLAQAQDGAYFVSAVMLEESRKPPSLTVRLAANKTPRVRAVEGLTRVLKCVEECARSSTKSEEHVSAILTRVVELSQARLYSRIKSAHGKKRKWPPNAQHNIPLHSKIQDLLAAMLSERPDPTGLLKPLSDRLNAFIQSLNDVENGSMEDQIELLGVAISKSFDVSNINSAKSLEGYLQSLGFDQDLRQSRTVLEIDKVSRYLELCHDLVRLSRRRRSQVLFKNISFEVCTSPPAIIPAGARLQCRVHGEVQLIMFNEQYPKQPPPRAIGSSKSACLLCDIFVRKHGKYQLSHSHKRLYEQWTLPRTDWMNEEQRLRFRRIIQEMNTELVNLRKSYKRRHFYVGSGPESRAHLLVLPEGTAYTSPTASITSRPKDSKSEITPQIEIRTTSVNSSTSVSTSSSSNSRSIYYFQDLPIKLTISASVLTCTLLAGKVDYIFDLAEVETGQLLVTDSQEAESNTEDLRTNVRKLSSTLPKCLKSGDASQTITFYIHDDEKHELQVTMIWDKAPC